MAKRPVPLYDFKAFGAAIKAARNEYGESRKKVSDELYISPRYLANIENKGQQPSLQVFYDLVTRYHISVDQFFFPNSNAEKSTGRRQLDALLDGMSDKGIRIVTATATRIDLSEGIQECLETVQDIKACNQEKTYLEKLDAKLDAAEKAQISSEMVSASLLTTGQMVLRLGLATVIVVGSSLILKEKIDLFTYILYLIAASRLYDPLSGAMANMAELFGVNLQVKRLKEIQEYPLENGQTEYHTKGYDVIFDHVKFSYETGKTVLKDVSFTAKQGQVTALVGPSGGGKSTIAKLAAKFYDVDGGKITLGGADIAKIDPVALMKDFSIVFQDVVLFNNTIMENIRVGRKGASDEDVIAAAKAAKCHDFIEKLPQGYQTVIGENGSTLSGGECQRLSIARALLKDAPVILLDEATASLDVDSETQIQEAISELVSGKTVLVIAHRMRTIEAADQIVVLDKGVVAEKGNHDTLMKKNGLYRKLVDLQTEAANWKLSV